MITIKIKDSYLESIPLLFLGIVCYSLAIIFSFLIIDIVETIVIGEGFVSLFWILIVLISFITLGFYICGIWFTLGFLKQDQYVLSLISKIIKVEITK